MTSTSQPRSARRFAATRPFGPAPTTIASGTGHPAQRPEHDVLAAGELHERLVGERGGGRGGHRVVAGGDDRVPHPPPGGGGVAGGDASGGGGGGEAGGRGAAPPPGARGR